MNGFTSVAEQLQMNIPTIVVDPRHLGTDPDPDPAILVSEL
jgi:hypothetical protein